MEDYDTHACTSIDPVSRGAAAQGRVPAISAATATTGSAIVSRVAACGRVSEFRRRHDSIGGRKRVVVAWCEAAAVKGADRVAVRNIIVSKLRAPDHERMSNPNVHTQAFFLRAK